MPIDPARALADIDDVLNYNHEAGGSGAVAEFAARLKACVARWAPPGSTYAKMADSVKLFGPKPDRSDQHLRGIVRTLRRDYATGNVATFEQLVHAAVFDDLLGQAGYFAEENHLLPAAVVAGAALEEHLRCLARSQGVDLHVRNARGVERPKAAGQLNDDLHRANAYEQPQWRQLQVWIDLRNEAAHGRPEF